MIEAGILDRTVIFERETEAVTASGAVSKSWSPIVVVRAEVREARSEEVAQGFGEGDRETMIFVVRWHPSPISTGDRVVYNGRAYDIRRIVELGRRVGWKIEGVAQ